MKLRKKVLSLLVTGVMVVGSVASVSAATSQPTYDYNSFPTMFNYSENTPPSTHHVSQSVEVLSNAAEYAYARCDSYIYEGNQPVLTVTSGNSEFPTYSVSFTSKNTVGSAMKYTRAIPVRGAIVKFNGVVSKYSNSFTIFGSVKG